ncbi:MAG TPA: NADP-dependent phosphogluconate dehydrogenase [Chloroflexota bacterium]|nr:NADP-dependent phosphogluconate dehydrogenase [Chloroflexota bacterium]
MTSPQAAPHDSATGGASIGLIGLAVMGENLALNIERNGFPIAVYNRTAERTRDFAAKHAQGKKVAATYTIDEFVGALSRPRRIIMMVQAGAPVDAVIGQLLPFLEPGDVVMDGGNSNFKDTERRGRELATAGVHYFGVGISGGEEGALKGPSIMPGGPREAYHLIEPILTKIAAKVPDGPCTTYIGPGGAGHYVKMIHNGIEYGDMQLIAEAYDLLGRTLGLGAQDISEIFQRWNQGELDSYLIEITARVLAEVDSETGKPLVDVILDQAGQKGTGRWTSHEALELGIPIPTIDAAIWARTISAFKEERVHASQYLRGPDAPPEANGDKLIEEIRQALYSSKIASYAQGMALLSAASREYKFELNLAEVARIWKGGCIIRAKLLGEIQAAYQKQPDLKNLMLDEAFRQSLNNGQTAWRDVVCTAKLHGVPCPASSASLDYFDSYRSARLPANLIQGQRDHFGAHTYQRVDRPGTFHTEWLEE